MGASSVLARVDGALARVGRSAPTVWRTSRRVVSVTFDDFPATAGTAGAAVLESLGVRGTFYTCFGTLGGPSASGPLATLEQVLALSERGHEVGCHTVDHLDCRITAPHTLLASLHRNAEAARTAGLPALRSFAYPFGRTALSKRGMVASRFRTARSVRSGINRGRFDAGMLRAAPLMRRDGVESALTHIRQLAAADGWLVLYSHDVQPDPSTWGCRPEELYDVCALALSLGVEILPVGAVLD